MQFFGKRRDEVLFEERVSVMGAWCMHASRGCSHDALDVDEVGDEDEDEDEDCTVQ